MMNLTQMKFDSQRGEWLKDDKEQSVYVHELERIISVAFASDREATVRTGMAITMLGTEIRVGRPWFSLGVQPEELFGQVERGEPV